MDTISITVKQSSLECAVCREPYDADERRPISLLCSHSLCGMCVKGFETNYSLETKISKSGEKIIYFPCPLDRRKVHRLNTNYNLNSIVTDASISNERNHQRSPDSKQTLITANAVPNDSDIRSNSESTLHQCGLSPDVVISSQPRSYLPVEETTMASCPGTSGSDVWIKQPASLDTESDPATPMIHNQNNPSSEPPEAMVIHDSDRKGYAALKTIDDIGDACLITIGSTILGSVSLPVSALGKFAFCGCLDVGAGIGSPVMTFFGPPVALGLSAAGIACSAITGVSIPIIIMKQARIDDPTTQDWFALLITQDNLELFKKPDPSPEDISTLETLVDQLTHEINNNINNLIRRMIEMQNYAAFPRSTECCLPCQTIERRSSYFRKKITHEGIKTLRSCLEHSKRKHQERYVQNNTGVCEKFNRTFRSWVLSQFDNGL